MRYAGRLSAEEFWGHITDLEQRVRAAAGTLPCYGVAGWSGGLMLGDWEWQDDQLVATGLAHGAPDSVGPAVHVHTTAYDPRRKVVALQMAAHGAPLGSRSPPPAQPAASREVPISVDGVVVPFAVWDEADQWWATATMGDWGLLLEGDRVPAEQVALVRVDDLEPYLSGSRVYLRAYRGEA